MPTTLMISIAAASFVWCVGVVAFALWQERRVSQASLEGFADALSDALLAAGHDRRGRRRDAP